MLYDGLLTLTKKSVLRIRDVYPGPNWSIPDPGPEFFHPGSRIRIFPSRTPDPNFSIPDPGQKHPRIPDPNLFFILDPDQGAKSIGFRIRIRNTGRNPRRRRKQRCTVELYTGRHIDLDEEMLEGDGLVCVVVHVGVPEVGEYSQLSRHCLKNREINQSATKKVARIAKKRELRGGCRTVFYFNCIGLHIV